MGIINPKNWKFQPLQMDRSKIRDPIIVRPLKQTQQSHIASLS